MNRKILIIISFSLIVFLAHFVVRIGSPQLHIVHLLLRSMFLLPILASAIWFGLRGGFITSVLISLFYSFHIIVSWAGQPMENANQIVIIGVYLLIGIVAGGLTNQVNNEHAQRLLSESRSRREKIIQGLGGLAEALKYRDACTRDHSENVANIAVKIGTLQGLETKQLETLRLAALVHDIGKIGVRDDVLHNPRNLSEEERQNMEQHPIVGSNILAEIEGAEEIAWIVRCHHECLDGSGYPDGIREIDIPKESMILSVADVFSALTEDRSYKTGFNYAKAIKIIDSMAGTKLKVAYINDLKQILLMENEKDG